MGENIIERAHAAFVMASAAIERDVPLCELTDDETNALLRATIAALREPSEAMWDGLARAIMMWLDMEPKTPRALFRHLESCGHPIPDWLRDEPEMKNLDHVPSKGTRCVIIWRAMLEGALTEGTEHAG